MKPKPRPVLLLLLVLPYMLLLLCVVALQARKPICMAAVSAGAAVAAAAALRLQHEELVRVYECQPAVLLEVLQEAALVSTVLIRVSEVGPPAGTACTVQYSAAQHGTA
jgi:hypothetical protein